jgi:hypothetical protein
MEDNLYFYKYLKYKQKYLKLKELLGGGGCGITKLEYISSKKIGIIGESRKYHPRLGQAREYALQFTYSGSGTGSSNLKEFDKTKIYNAVFPITGINSYIIIQDQGNSISLKFERYAKFPFSKIKSEKIFINNRPVPAQLQGKEYIFRKTKDSFICTSMNVREYVQTNSTDMYRHKTQRDFKRRQEEARLSRRRSGSQ